MSDSLDQINKENPYRIESGYLYTMRDGVVGRYPMLKRSGPGPVILDMTSRWLTYEEMITHYIEEQLDGYTRKNMTKADRDDLDEKWLEVEMFRLSMYGYHLADNPVFDSSDDDGLNGVQFVVNFLKSVYDRLKLLEQDPTYDNSIQPQDMTRMERYYTSDSAKFTAELDRLEEEACRYYMKYLRKNARNKELSDEEIIKHGFR